MNQAQSQRSLANVCLFCGERLSSPMLCTFCGFKFCSEHKPTEKHQCIKTRYTEYVRNTNPTTPTNITSGNFRVVCEMCGFNTTKGVPIEYAGEQLIQHTQIVGCSKNVFLEEISESAPPKPITKGQTKTVSKKNPVSKSPHSQQPTSIVDQIIQLSNLKEKGLISEQEFSHMKQELIKKLK